MSTVIVDSVLRLANSGVKLTSQILARTSPRELKELERLGKRKLKYESKISDYKRSLPSERNQAKLEIYIKELEETCNEIILMQTIAGKKLELMLAQLNNNTPDAPADS